MTISHFTGKYDFLSNFYPSPVAISFNGDILTANTVEHAFQALKVDPDTEFAYDKVRYVLNAQTPGSAKKRGRAVPLRRDWDEIRIPVMDSLLVNKFQPMNLDLRARLLATGAEELVEGNTWGDTFWGVDLLTGKGENHLGRLLMKCRGSIALDSVQP